MDLQRNVEQLRAQLATEQAELEEGEVEVRRLEALLAQKRDETGNLYNEIQMKLGNIHGLVSQREPFSTMIEAARKIATELKKPDQCLVERENILGPLKAELADLMAKLEDDNYLAEENAQLEKKNKELEVILANRKAEREMLRQKIETLREEQKRMREEALKTALERQSQEHELQKKILRQKFMNMAMGKDKDTTN